MSNLRKGFLEGRQEDICQERDGTGRGTGAKPGRQTVTTVTPSFRGRQKAFPFYAVFPAVKEDAFVVSGIPFQAAVRSAKEIYRGVRPSNYVMGGFQAVERKKTGTKRKDKKM